MLNLLDELKMLQKIGSHNTINDYSNLAWCLNSLEIQRSIDVNEVNQFKYIL